MADRPAKHVTRIPMSEREWFTPEEACEYLGISRSSLYRRVKGGHLTVYHPPWSKRMMRFKKYDLDNIFLPDPATQRITQIEVQGPQA